MPNSKQAKKRVRQNEKRRDENKVVRSSMRSAMKKVLQAESPEEAQKELPTAMKRVDKAAKRNIIHDNAAARLKSRLSRAAQPKA
ncbi:MAG: 30S ribosomal protein S20 [Planctomycetota bacterium]